MPDFEIEFLIETHAFNIGIRAVLKQNDLPIGYISRVIKKSEKNYGITDKETLAYFELWKSFLTI